ncbi:flagellar basal body protein [Sphingomonas sp. H160509]|uniref:flagellar basal body protein n=1 Tax=Sphingomonas sp. H160509 TaxID=2955313 RepID=UPI00209784C8|nr:flagellar basal body protein [Sphingomonas sp. H160509]MDD1452128.1 flagellar basal body protein [Sphingomonas sp. H160509]
MSDLLSIGASGVRAYQTALSTVSENIANTGTVGYTRRTTTLAEVSSVNGGINARNSATGSGVIVVGVGRSANAYRSQAVRSAGTDLGKTETSVAWMSRIEIVARRQQARRSPHQFLQFGADPVGRPDLRTGARGHARSGEDCRPGLCRDRQGTRYRRDRTRFVRVAGGPVAQLARYRACQGQ